MIVTLQLGKRIYEVDCWNPIDIAISLDFSEKQLQIHPIKKASAAIHEVPGLIGDTRQGGSCNWEEYTFTPHSHGTHTESVGHITEERFPINKALKELLIPVTLITVTPERASESSDTYIPQKDPADMLITRKLLEDKLQLIPRTFCKGLVIRTGPNEPEKRFRDYRLNPPPYFSCEAMEYLASINVEHLLVDLPSIDRLQDEGKLHNHRYFWNIPLGTRHLTKETHCDKTVTELIYVPETITDDLYALNLQIPSFATDAAPSRPLLFPVKSLT